MSSLIHRYGRACTCAAVMLAFLVNGAAAQTTHQVNQTGFSFVPAGLTIQAGDVVQWNWSSGFHTVTSGLPCTPDGLFDAPLDPGHPQFSRLFDTPGTYPYFCRPHCLMGMTGTIIVVPPPCLPDPTGRTCRDTFCGTPGGQCRPKCVRQDPATGEYFIVECACVEPEECHLELTQHSNCIVPDNGAGTADLPPVGCIYDTPFDDMRIIDGLPAGTTIEIDASQGNFVCPGGSGICSFPPGPPCAIPGGSLGGLKSCADGILTMPMQGTGTLSGFNRNISLPFQLEIHTAPRVNGNPLQSFNTDFFRMFGQITGDPDFDLLRVVGGTDFGLPSPGHTTLTQLGPNWQVDSFFDITYRIDFVGAPGGSLAGLFGSTTGAVRFRIAGAVATPICVGTCPPGTHCELTETVSPGGLIDLCCNCVPDQPAECLPDPAGRTCQPTACPEPGEECLPRCVVMEDGVPRVVECDCRNPQECHVELILGGDPPCVGDCPPGFTCQRTITPTPTGYMICCDCVPVPTECAPTPDGQNCEPYLCPVPPPDHECRPRCIRTSLTTGQTWIIECECRGQGECRPYWQPGTVPFCEGNCPPGYTCLENRITNPDGTIDLCCDCIQQFCRCPGDINGDGLVNGLDIQGFVNCFLGVSTPADNCACADMNGDGLLDMLDVSLFVARLLACLPCEPEPCPPQDLYIDLTTGVDQAGNLIPVGTDDDTWTVTVDASGGTVPRPATVINPHPAWQTIPGSRWISANYYGPNGTYKYEVCFCLDRRFANPVLNLLIRVDDAGDVYLNGNFIGAAASFGAATPANITVTDPSLFVVGRNCLTVVVRNIGGPPTGMNLAGSFQAARGKCCCEEADLDASIDTGVEDGTGNLLPIGANDDTWEVTVDPSGGTVPRPATVINPHPAWLTIPGTQWISAAATGPNGSYTYRHCFCLDPRFQNAQLVLDLRADDSATVFLNGVQVGATPLSYAFNTPQPTHVFVANQALFRPGENCIEIVVVNGGGVVTGLNLAGRITARNGRCCTDRLGACCFRGGACFVLSVDECMAADGSPQGPGTVCLGDNDGNGIDDACQPPPPYACCFENGECIDLPAGVAQCPTGGLLIAGPCGNTLACCLPDGTCLDTNEICCREAGGTPQGPGTSCATFSCQLPQEYSCCRPDGSCVDLAPGVTQCPGGGTLMLGPCGMYQACCLPDGTCQDLAVACCHMLGGTPQGPGTICQGLLCQPPATCIPDPAAPRCLPGGCQNPAEVCVPRCVLVEGATGYVISVVECDCRRPNAECYAGITPAPSVFTGCTGVCPPGAPYCFQAVTDHGNGTYTVCCDCWSVPPN